MKIKDADLVVLIGKAEVISADGLVVLCVGDVNRPMKVLRNVLDLLDLQLNETHGKHCECLLKRALIFWGSPYVEPSAKSVERIKDCVKILTDRKRALNPCLIWLQR